MNKFNLKSHMKKRAFNEGAQELMRAERKMADCQKRFLDEGMGLHEARQKCQDLYDNSKGKKDSFLE